MKFLFEVLVAFLLSAILVIVTGPRAARADDGVDAPEPCNVLRRDFYRGWSVDWPDECGSMPDLKRLAELRADCARTRARIEYEHELDPAAGSWNRNWGIYGEEACLNMDFGGSL